MNATAEILEGALEPLSWVKDEVAHVRGVVNSIRARLRTRTQCPSSAEVLESLGTHVAEAGRVTELSSYPRFGRSLWNTGCVIEAVARQMVGRIPSNNNFNGAWRDFPRVHSSSRHGNRRYGRNT